MCSQILKSMGPDVYFDLSVVWGKKSWFINNIGPKYMSHDMRLPTMWYVRPAKAQTSLCIRTDWSEPLLVAWVFYEC